MMRTSRTPHSKHLKVGALLVFLFVIVSFFVFPKLGASVVWRAPGLADLASSTPIAMGEEVTLPPRVTHLPTPVPVRAVYMSACTASVPSLREKLVALATSTEVNAIVVDIKDFSGAVSFPRESTAFDVSKRNCDEVGDMREFLNHLHDNNIYTIGRITVFQDPNYSDMHPEVAVQKKDGSVWRDRKGLAFVDVSAKSYWDEIISLAKDSHAIGFDEINFDYIRFPSDGDMQNIHFALTGSSTKPDALKNFFSYLHASLEGTGIVTSADLFGMTTSNRDDLGIGQVLENALPYFDYVAPMVYPSHYPPGFNGYKNPADHPYDIISYAMGKGVERAKEASTTPLKLRAWLQDFNLGATYTPDMIEKQKQALYDLGLDSWMMWSPSNKYTKAALEPEQ